jgi:hypothetical protein
MMTAKNLLAQAPEGGQRELYSVFHVKRNAPEEFHIDVISAADEEGAHRVAEKLFWDSTILRIFREGETWKAVDYPSARFIKGSFHADTHAQRDDGF